LSTAVVLGGGFAGVLAAMVLAEHVDDVTLVEGADYPSGPRIRRGLPQAHHSHILVTGGARALEALLPGTVAALAASGAQRRGFSDGTLILSANGWFRRHRTEADLISCSRWLMDLTVRKRALNGSTVSVRERTVALGLVGDAAQVHGVAIRTPQGRVETLRADIVVDATGRRSQAARWLRQLGAPAVDEEKVDSGLAYSTRFYQAPAELAATIPAIMIHPLAEPGRPGRGATLYPIEGGRWVVTLTGTRGGEPPTDDHGFLEFVRSVRSPVITELITAAEPLGGVRPYRNTSNRRRRFERVPLPAGLLVMGDALVAVNPIHSHGMSVAALSVLRLRAELARVGTDPRAVSGLQAAMAEEADTSWQMAIKQDGRYIDDHAGRQPALTPFQRRAQNELNLKLLNSQLLMSEFFRTQALIPSDVPLGAAFLRELATGPERSLTEEEAIAQYPGLSEWWFSERRPGASVAS
jgi:flavin-dependent dehydrogenase